MPFDPAPFSESAECNVAFIGKEERKARCDFAVPTGIHPKVVVDAKEFDEVGHKFSQYFDEVVRIAHAKDEYFLLLTDGLGWHRQQEDLARLVRLQNDGLIDMIYTLPRLPQLAAEVQHIVENE